MTLVNILKFNLSWFRKNVKKIKILIVKIFDGITQARLKENCDIYNEINVNYTNKVNFSFPC